MLFVEERLSRVIDFGQQTDLAVLRIDGEEPGGYHLRANGDFPTCAWLAVRLHNDGFGVAAGRG